MRVIIDHTEAIEAMINAVNGSLGVRLSRAQAHLYLKLNPSPAVAFPESEAILLHKGLPEGIIPYAIDHEALHIIVYRVALNGENTPKAKKQAMKASLTVDFESFRDFQAKVFNLDSKAINGWIKLYVLKTWGPFRVFKKIKQAIWRMKHAFSY